MEGEGEAEVRKFVLESVVRGYHVYQTMWEAAICEELPCKAEGGNCSDRFAVAVVKDGIVVGHVPRIFSAACTIFLKRVGVILCRV